MIALQLAPLAILLLQICYGSGQSTADILTAPVSARVAPDDIVSFNCTAMACNEHDLIKTAHWVINDTHIVAAHPNIDNLGFQINDTQRNNINSSCAVFTLGLTLRVSNNISSTQIKCAVISGSAYGITPALLTVLGAPSPPLPKMSFYNESAVRVTWEPPYSPDEYPITGYTYDVQNITSGESLDFGNVMETCVEYSFAVDGIVPVCAEVTFRVSAMNSLGTSHNGTLLAQQNQIASFQSLVRATMLFTADAAPNLMLDFQLPDVCYFQEMNYTILIEADDGSGIVTVGPKTVQEHQALYCPPDPDKPLVRSIEVIDVVSVGLAPNASYTVNIRVDSIAGSAISEPVYTTTVSELLTLSSAEDTEDVPPCQQKTTSNPAAYAVLGAYAAIVSVLLCISALLLCFCTRRIKRSTDTIHANNPISTCQTSASAPTNNYQTDIGNDSLISFHTERQKAQRALVDNPCYEETSPTEPVYEFLDDTLTEDIKIPKSHSATQPHRMSSGGSIPSTTGTFGSFGGHNESDLSKGRQVKETLQLPGTHKDAKVPVNGSINLAEFQDPLNPATDVRQTRSKLGSRQLPTIPIGRPPEEEYITMSPAAATSHSVVPNVCGKEKSPMGVSLHSE